MTALFDTSSLKNALHSAPRGVSSKAVTLAKNQLSVSGACFNAVHPIVQKAVDIKHKDQQKGFARRLVSHDTSERAQDLKSESRRW